MTAADRALDIHCDLEQLAREIHEQLVAGGSYDVEPMPEWALAALKADLIGSEANELLEELRAGREHEPSDKCPELTREEDEWADIFARALDYAAHRGIRTGFALATKMRFNATRPYRHGGKRF